MAVGRILLEAIVWSALWMVMVSLSVRRFPFTIEHDYPEEARRVANLPKPSPQERRRGILFGAVSFLILFGLLLAFAVFDPMHREPSFTKIFLHLWLICMAWNVVDLVIVDWLLICTLSVACYLLPGTEEGVNHRQYRFHAIGFAKGFVVMSLIALLLSAVAYGILLLIR